MHYLIDGHNVIAKMPDIDLSDPDDEAQLILRLRGWVSGNLKRRVTVYFDGGLQGGPAHHLSGNRLEVMFAPHGLPADDLIIATIRRVRDPLAYVLITSDREIIAAAEKRRMPHVTADHFAEKLAEALAPPEPAPAPEPKQKPLLSESEVAAWMELFGPEPEIPPSPPGSRSLRRRSPAEEEAAEEEEPEPTPRDADVLKDTGELLTDEEVALWLEMFGPGPEPEDVPEEAFQEASEEALQEAGEEGRAAARELRRKRREKRQQRGEMRPADRLKQSGASLSKDEVDEWLDIFTDPEAE